MSHTITSQQAPAQPPIRLQKVQGRKLRPLQRVVAALALIAPLVIIGALASRLLGLTTTEQMVELALGAGENPGTFTFAAMFLASPIQWLTGRSQIRIRKLLGIVFYGLAVNNFAMFVIEQQLTGEVGLAARIGGSPMILAGLTALLLATPLFLTSSRWSQRFLGMRRWRMLHRLTYVIAVALVVHVLLIPDVGPDTVLLGLGFIARVPAVHRRLVARGKRNR